MCVMLERDLQRLKVILSKIDMIDEIVDTFSYVTKALEDEVLAKPAIMMHLTAIAEQFSKLKDETIVSQFEKNDVKGAIATRNFIAHDYDGVNMSFIETVVKERLPVVKNVILKTLEEAKKR